MLWGPTGGVDGCHWDLTPKLSRHNLYSPVSWVRKVLRVSQRSQGGVLGLMGGAALGAGSWVLTLSGLWSCLSCPAQVPSRLLSALSSYNWRDKGSAYSLEVGAWDLAWPATTSSPSSPPHPKAAPQVMSWGHTPADTPQCCLLIEKGALTWRTHRWSTEVSAAGCGCAGGPPDLCRIRGDRCQVCHTQEAVTLRSHVLWELKLELGLIYQSYSVLRREG